MEYNESPKTFSSEIESTLINKLGSTQGTQKIYNNLERYVDFENVTSRYMVQFIAAYEKANNWPVLDAKNGIAILNEEIDEVYEAAGILEHEKPLLNNMPSDIDIGNTRARAVSVILEALQVISVCDKYQKVFTFENVKQKSEE